WSGKSRRSSPCERRPSWPPLSFLGAQTRATVGFVVESSLPRLRGITVSVRTFRRVALANVLWLFVIVASGASVRLTDSGLGCLDWPGCSAGAFVPKDGFHSFVEFSNRIVSGVA